MNERIQELAEQAKKLVPAGLIVDKWIECYNEELAKLIIDDCIEIIYNQERLPQGFIMPKSTATYELAIRNHFGIE